MRYNKWGLFLGVVASVVLLATTSHADFSELGMLLPDDGAANDLFAESVAISGDYAIVGAPGQDGVHTDIGSAYIFKWTQAEGWTQIQQLTASDGDLANTESFGWSVAIDGDYAIVGAYKMSGRGAAYIFMRDGDVWSEQQKIVSDDIAGSDDFGISVAISGDYAIIGAERDDDTFNVSGSAYIFTRTGESWAQQAKLHASDPAAILYFGTSVSISGDYAIVGTKDQGDSSRGQAYIFERAGESWNQVAKIEPDDLADSDRFGGSVAISGDHAIVGAIMEEGDGFGSGTDHGAAYVFERDVEGTWAQMQKLQGELDSLDYFGASVAIAGDHAVVGATISAARADTGYATTFTLDAGTWVQVTKLQATEQEGGLGNQDFFGNSVAITDSGQYALVGSYQDDNVGGDNAGAAYIFYNPPPNAVPVADADDDATDQPDGVAYTLSGTCTDADAADTLTGWWLQVSGTDCGLTGDVVGSKASGNSSVTVEASCTPEVSANETLVFRLTCDDETEQATDDRSVGVNAKPTATPQSVTTDEDAAVAITLAGSDPDDEVLTFAVASDPTHGVLSGVAPDLIYTPTADYFGSDAFTFTVDDGVQASAAATVSITVSSTYVAPSIADAAGQVVTCVLGSACQLPSWAVTDDEDVTTAVSWETISGPGALTISAEGEIDIVSDPPKRGTYYVQLVADDGISTTRSELVEVVIPNHAPYLDGADDIVVEGAVVADDGTFVLSQFLSELDIQAVFVDDDGDSLAYSWAVDVSDADRAGFTSTTSGSSALRLRMAGALTVTVSVDDGFGGEAVEEIVVSVPVPEVDSDDLELTVTLWTYAEDGTLSIVGTLKSPIWPVVIINGTVVATVTLQDEEAEAEVIDGVAYETYSFTADGVPEGVGDVPVSVEVFTTVDGDGVTIVDAPVELTSGQEDDIQGSDAESASGGGCTLIEGAQAGAEGWMAFAIILLSLLVWIGRRRAVRVTSLSSRRRRL